MSLSRLAFSGDKRLRTRGEQYVIQKKNFHVDVRINLRLCRANLLKYNYLNVLSAILGDNIDCQGRI